jgi:hypothetical protein
MLAARHDATPWSGDPLRRDPPAGPGYVSLRDLESGRRMAVDLGARSRRHYAAAARLHRESLARAFYRVPMEHVFVSTDEPPVEPLLALFASRMRR